MRRFSIWISKPDITFLQEKIVVLQIMYTQGNVPVQQEFEVNLMKFQEEVE